MKMSEDGFSDSYDEPTMDLVIETLTGTSFEMKVCPSDTVLDIKNKIQRVEGIPVHHQNLLFRLNELKDYNRLCDVGIQNGSVLKLVLSMRGGPISTRRLSSADHHIWKDLKELLENTREELGDKLGPGSKVSVLVFKDGDIINLIRVIENDTASFYPMIEGISTRNKQSVREDTRASFCSKLKENDDMLTKLTELRKKMSELTLKRNLRHMDCTSNSVFCKEFNGNKEPSKSNKNNKKQVEHTSTDAKKRDSIYNISFKLLEDLDKGDEEIAKKKSHDSKTSNVKDESSQSEEDSIALKEKHRGNKSKHNFLYTNFAEARLRPDKSFKVNQTTSIGLQCHRKPDDLNTFGAENREKPNCSHRTESDNVKLKQPCYKKVKLSPKSARKETQNLDEKVTIWSPLSPILNRGSPSSLRHMRPQIQENSVNIPEVPCQIDLSAPSPTPSIAILEEEETENEEKELLSPIGLPCVGTVSMSKVPDLHRVRLTPLVYSDRTKRSKNNPEKLDLDDNCDIFPKESKETCRSTANCKIGLLRSRQSMECSSRSTNEPNEQNKPTFFKQSLFEEVNGDLFFPHFVPMGPSAIPSEYTPRDEGLGDYCFGNHVNYSRYLRSPLYRRQSQMSNVNNDQNLSANEGGMGSTGSTKPRNLRHFSWNSHLQSLKSTCSNNSNLSNIELDTKLHKKCETNESMQIQLKTGSNDAKIKSDKDKVKVVELPAVIAKKKIRCGLCNKRLNITNMYDCRCGGTFCSQHRYSEVHGCKFDYKTEGRKLLEKQNPLVIAEKLQKF